MSVRFNDFFTYKRKDDFLIAVFPHEFQPLFYDIGVETAAQLRNVHAAGYTEANAVMAIRQTY